MLPPLHSFSVQELQPLVELARRRCGDEKAGARRAGLQLLEALLLMNASDNGGAKPQLPAAADVAAIEAATADPLVNKFVAWCRECQE